MQYKKLQKILKSKDIDCAFITNLFGEDVNVKYLLGIEIGNSFLICPKKGNLILLVSRMEISFAKKKLKGIKILEFDAPITKQISDIIEKLEVKNVGLNERCITMEGMMNLQKGISGKSYIDISDDLIDMRACKDTDEIKKTEKACKISDEIFSELNKKIKKFKTESEIVEFLKIKTIEKGCDWAFPPLVASGKNSSYPHFPAEAKKLGKGFMFIDFGVDYQGYKSDTTRVYYLGSPTKKDLEIYEKMLRIQEEAVKMIAPGFPVGDIEKYVRRELGKDEENFTHSLGHGVGLAIHEAPGVNAANESKLKEGMILTIEPGVYFDGKFGIRIEDTVLVTKTGYRVLTKTPKELITIK